MLSPVGLMPEFRDVDRHPLVRDRCEQQKVPLTRGNATLLHNPQGLLQLLPFLDQNTLKKEQSCANQS